MGTVDDMKQKEIDIPADIQAFYYEQKIAYVRAFPCKDKKRIKVEREDGGTDIWMFHEGEWHGAEACGLN